MPENPLNYERGAHAIRVLGISAGGSQFVIRAVPEHRRARVSWIRFLQGVAFADAIRSIQAKGVVATSSPVNNLTPFIDDDGLLRVGGRICHVSVPFDSRHPIVLPRHPFVRLIVENAHQRSVRGGFNLTISVLRQSYWMLGARSAVRSVVHRCVVCARHRANTGLQIMLTFHPLE